jgi:hypothetical protein
MARPYPMTPRACGGASRTRARPVEVPSHGVRRESSTGLDNWRRGRGGNPGTRTGTPSRASHASHPWATARRATGYGTAGTTQPEETPVNPSDARGEGPWTDPQTHVDTDPVNAPDDEPDEDDDAGRAQEA